MGNHACSAGELEFYPAMLIVFDGIEGAGKSTQVRHFHQRLKQEGKKIRTLRDPGGTGLGEILRGIVKGSECNITPKAELLLFSAARAQLIEEVMKPALQAGEYVICDRFFFSTVAYQGRGRGLKEEVQWAIAASVGDFQPGCTFILDISLDDMRQRVQARGEVEDRFEQEGEEFFSRVIQGFQSFTKWPNVETIKAAQAEEKVSEDIWRIWTEKYASLGN